MRLENTSIVVTGASRGLGAALARALAEAGARLVLVARDPAALEEVAAGIRAKGGEAHAIAADVADAGSAARIAGFASAVLGPVDVLIHGASSLGPVPLVPLAETDDRDFEAALQTNLLGPFRLTRAFAGSMALARRGLVVHVTSDAATSAYPRWGAYGVSKAALEHLGRIWAAELEDTGVRFLNVDPGEMDTRMHRDAMPDADRAALARPEDVATRFVTLLVEATSEKGPVNGGRVELSEVVR
jgi:NAD(P)-dependent dehydrogenase (short-subunit alcohol dehydrogenase family)